MPTLSIIIPTLGQVELMERSLVSVLTNRPADCDVLVVLNEEYDDPYQLTDEVRFVHAPQGATWAASIATALAETTSDVVHLLACGAEVDEGWTDPALHHFDDRNVAAVAPLLIDPKNNGPVGMTGVTYRAAGIRRVRMMKKLDSARVAKLAESKAAGIGPTRHAAFWRTDVLRELLADSAASVGDELADVDMALAMQAMGMRVVFEPASCVTMNPGPPSRSTSLAAAFIAGRRAERLFWRHAPLVGRLRAMLLHPLALASDWFAPGPWGSGFARTAGRLFAALEMRSYRR